MALIPGQSLGQYLAGERASRGLSQDALHEAGGPRRHVQTGIEADKATDNELSRHLPEYDRAYGRPAGFTQALQRHIAASHANGVGALPEVTYTGHYRKYAPQGDQSGFSRRNTVLGFRANPGDGFGEPVYLEYQETVLTNVPPLRIAAVAKSRAWLTFIDAALAELSDDGGKLNLHGFRHATQHNHPVDDEIANYQIGTTLDPNLFGWAITVDPTAGLKDIGTARALAAALLAARPLASQTLNSVACTLLGIAAYSGDGLRTISDLALGTDTEFRKYWKSTFYDPDYASPDLAMPASGVPTLLSGVLAARDANTTISIEKSGLSSISAPAPKWSAPKVADIYTDIFDRDCTFVTYDSRLSPEIPAVLTRGAQVAALQFYAATGPLRHIDTLPAHAAAQKLGCGIGITDQDDNSVLGTRGLGHGTLTHWDPSLGTAIYCPPHPHAQPIRIYLPPE